MANFGGPEESVLSAFLSQYSLWDYVYRLSSGLRANPFSNFHK